MIKVTVTLTDAEGYRLSEVKGNKNLTIMVIILKLLHPQTSYLVYMLHTMLTVAPS